MNKTMREKSQPRNSALKSHSLIETVKSTVSKRQHQMEFPVAANIDYLLSGMQSRATQLHDSAQKAKKSKNPQQAEQRNKEKLMDLVDYQG